MPEYVGKMQFYLALLDDKLRLEDENPAIGGAKVRENGGWRRETGGRRRETGEKKVSRKGAKALR